MPKSDRIAKERKQYHPDVDVLYQKNAWADDVTSVASLKLVANQTRMCEEVLLVLDNLHGHKCEKYVDTAKENNILLKHTPEDCTDLCAVNDHHLGVIPKRHMKKQYNKEVQEDWKAWNETITASQKRIKYTHWLAQAWGDMKTRQKTIHEAFVTCGVLNAIDGSEDHLIKINGVDANLQYKVQEVQEPVGFVFMSVLHLVCTGGRR
jgi:hypothetical protein